MNALTTRLRNRLPLTGRLGRRIPRLGNARNAAPDGDEHTCPVEMAAQGSRVAQLPIPDGWTRDDVYDLLASVSIEASPPGELGVYVREDFERFLITWDLVRDRSGAALEIGANPYFISVLLREFTDHDHAAAFVDAGRLVPLVGHRLPDPGQYLFCRATKVAEPTDGRPVDLYRSWSADPLVEMS